MALAAAEAVLRYRPRVTTRGAFEQRFGHRNSWLRRFAVRSGRLYGSIRYGVLYL